VSAPELSVVCKSCGSEVSPYVTECPYCGTRLRKRAPKLERHGDELTPRESRRLRRRRVRERLSERLRLVERPYATVAAILAPAVLLLVQRATDRPLTDFGAIVGPVGSAEWWRYLTSPFVYSDIGYLFVIALAVVIFGGALERRLGTVATVVLILACGGLGMLIADALETAVAGEGDILIAAGGNGIALGLLAAWAVIKAGEVRGRIDEETEVIGAAVAATVLLALPLVEDSANVFAGLGGAAVGALAGLAAAYSRRPAR
jgi:membrane associated rhomboid family serine protease